MEWIKVSDRLPDIYTQIVPVISHGQIFYAQYVNNVWLFRYISDLIQIGIIINLPNENDVINVTHWMLLPEVPKERYDN